MLGFQLFGCGDNVENVLKIFSVDYEEIFTILLTKYEQPVFPLFQRFTGVFNSFFLYYFYV